MLSYFNISKPTFIFTDAHQSGLSTMVTQSSYKDNANPVAPASRCTSKGEKSYAQLDFEAMAVDFALRRFCLYLVGAPNDTTIVTDHLPLPSVFNGKRNGLIRTKFIKLRLQGIRFSLEYRKGITNPVDYLNRHGIPWKTLSKNEKKNESADQTNLYTFYVTPVLGTIGIEEISEETYNEPTLQDLRHIIQSGTHLTSYI